MDDHSMHAESPFYKAIMQSAVDPIIIIDDKGYIDDTNQATSHLFGYSREELIGKKLNMLMPDNEAQSHDGYIKNFIATGHSKIIGQGREVIGKKKNGEYIDLHLCVSEALVNGKRFFTGILRDITALLIQQKRLEFQSNVLKGLNEWADISNQTIADKIRLFLDFINKYAGAYCATYTPHNDSERKLNLEDGYTNTIAPENADNYEHLRTSTVGLSRSRETLTDSHILNKVSSTDVTFQHIEAFPIYFEHIWFGTIRVFWTTPPSQNGFLLFSEIIQTCLNRFTTHLELQKNLAKYQIANDRFTRSQACANIGTWDWNIETGELYWTERIAPLFGYPEGELETSYDNFLDSLHPDDKEFVEAAIAKCIEEGEVYDIDHRVVWPDGTIRWVNEKGNVQRDKNGKAVKMLGVVQDIQRAKQAEEHLLHARIEAENASRAKSEFLSLMSHELRTPLNSILGFAQLMDMEKLNENQTLYVDQILHGGNLLLQLVNDVLDLAKIESNQNNVDITDVDLHHLIQQCIYLLTNQAKTADIRVTHACDSGHPLVRADYIRLKQVILNLLSNAIKYNRQGGEVSIVCETSKENILRLKVDDTGAGINPERYDEIFEPFSRLDFKNSSIEGVGIGLVVTKKLVEAMNGKIDFSSKLGKGSSFWVDLPLGDQIQTHAEEKKKSPPQLNSNLTILYVEDNPSNTRLVQMLLAQENNIQFLKAMTGFHGLELAKTHKPDLIILDINLPDISGIEVCELLKQDPSTSKIPTIALTADIARQQSCLNKNNHFEKIIYKPFEINELLEAINQFT